MRYVKQVKLDELFSDLMEKLNEAQSFTPRKFIIDYLTNLGPEPEDEKQTEKQNQSQDSGIEFVDLTILDDDAAPMDTSNIPKSIETSETVDLTNIPTQDFGRTTISSITLEAERALKDVNNLIEESSKMNINH
jgi:hypothetical protein